MPQARFNTLLIGGGGREHALAKALRDAPSTARLYATHTSNPGIADLARPTDTTYNPREIYRLKQFCRHHDISLVIVGPEGPLADGVADQLASDDVLVFGPTRDGARLEADKAWAKTLLRAASIPTADARVFTNPDNAIDFIRAREIPPVVKASGLAAGKGVFVPQTTADAIDAVNRIMLAKEFGDAGAQLLVEERLEGPEVSVFALTDGRDLVTLGASQDHKRLRDHDEGPNTGGMGAYCPTPLVDARLMARIEREILIPTVDALRREGLEYRGVLYAGLMLTHAGPKVLEYNVRFGDPECQVLLPTLDTDLTALLAACAQGKLRDAEIDWKPRAACCVVLAAPGYPDNPTTGSEITGIDDAESVPSVSVLHAGTRRDEQGRTLTAGGRVLNVVATGRDIAEAQQRCYEAADKVHFEGMQLRRDIAHQALARA